MILPLYKKTVLDFSRTLLFLLIISINIREPYFHSRELLFFLFVSISFSYGNYKKIINVLLLLALWGWSLVYNVLVPGSDAINGSWFQAIIISAYLFLMVFSKKEYYETIINAFLFSATLVSLITIGLWLLCWFVPAIRTVLATYFMLLHETTNLSFINIDTRMILGVPFFFVWYRTIPIVIPALGYYYIIRLSGNKNRKNLFRIILYTVALILSGTRADMMAAGLLCFFYLCFQLLRKRCFCTAYVLVLTTLCVGAVAAFSFLNDKGSKSSSIKHLHQISYFNTFDTDYARTLFFGWGDGSTFYTLGRRAFVDLTELSHWETIRRYGFISMVLIMFFIWLRPLIRKVLNEKSIIKYYYMLVVFAYIFVACTNPYLLDSLGFCVLLFFDAFFEFETCRTEKRYLK